MLVGTATTLAASVPSFAAGTALWSAALLLTSIPQGFASWTRLAGIIGATLFAVTSARIFWGEQVTNLLAIALLCIPVSRAYICGLDLESVERGFKDLHCFNT